MLLHAGCIPALSCWRGRRSWIRQSQIRHIGDANLQKLGRAFPGAGRLSNRFRSAFLTIRLPVCINYRDRVLTQEVSQVRREPLGLRQASFFTLVCWQRLLRWRRVSRTLLLSGWQLLCDSSNRKWTYNCKNEDKR